jgi:hypothetical protein
VIKFFLAEIADRYVRENFQKISDYLQSDLFARGKFSFFEYSFTAAAANLTLPHGLKFTPKDVIELHASNGVTVTWHYDNFTRTTIELSSSGAGTVRAYIGRYGEQG